MDEIIIKGQDGKWYVFKGDELLPLEQEARIADLPKVVKEEVRELVETKPPLNLPLVQREKEGVSRPPPVAHTEHPLFKELEELIAGVVKNVELRMSNPAPEQVRYGAGVEWLKDVVLAKRFRMIVSARLRDVRDALETRQMLARPQKIGGMGLAISGDSVSGAPETESRPVDQVMTVIERAFQEFQTKWKTVEDKRRQEWQLKQREQREQQKQRAQSKEEEELEQRYTRLTGGISKSPIHPGPEQSSVQGPAIPKEIPKSKSPIPKAPESRKVKPPLPPPPLASVPLTPRRYTLAPSPSSKITDVYQPPKLIGPLDEIRMLTLDDFRKLAATPPEAAQKILEKIEFLGVASLSQRWQAVESWRASPLHGVYRKISEQALHTKVSPQTLTPGGSTLTTDEFYAIMELNQKLRF